MDGQLVANCAFTRCTFAKASLIAALLGPVAVLPDCAGQGIGSRLIRQGLDTMRADGVACIFVLGDPAFYQRYGFTCGYRITPPYPLPQAWTDGWQSRWFAENQPPNKDQLLVPPPWQNEVLWK